MDNSLVGLPTSENGNWSNGSHKLETIHELGNEFQDKLLVKDENFFQCYNDLSFDDSIRGTMEDGNTSGSKCLKKCATFPVTIYAEKNDKLQLENKSLPHSSSLPTTRKLVSAMKGGREKEGMPPKKLSVSWAADVYDPPPTSVSHYPMKKSQKHYKSSKKNGKNKQKGKSTRTSSSSSKDKKHSNRRNSDNDRVMSMSSNNHNLPLGFLDFDEIGGREPNCGSSFRGKACGGAVHFAYAEAT